MTIKKLLALAGLVAVLCALSQMTNIYYFNRGGAFQLSVTLKGIARFGIYKDSAKDGPRFELEPRPYEEFFR